MENKTGKYFKYAIGEIILVVIGILIALWLNNLNQQRIELRDSSNLKLALKEELLENKKSFKSYKSYVEQCHGKIITVLNVSAGDNDEINIDTLKKLVIEMMPAGAIDINESRLNAAKASGQFRLLTSEESTALTSYETNLDGFKEARKLNNIFNNENRPLFLYFSLIDDYNKRLYPNVVLTKHLDYNLSDEDFLSFLKKRETYLQLSSILTSILVDIQWLGGLDKNIDETIEALN
jgi:hypothetical protein